MSDQKVLLARVLIGLSLAVSLVTMYAGSYNSGFGLLVLTIAVALVNENSAKK